MIIWVLSLCIESTRMDICIPSSFLLLYKRFYTVWMRAFHSYCLKSINVSFFPTNGLQLVSWWSLRKTDILSVNMPNINIYFSCKIIGYKDISCIVFHVLDCIVIGYFSPYIFFFLYVLRVWKWKCECLAKEILWMCCLTHSLTIFQKLTVKNKSCLNLKISGRWAQMGTRNCKITFLPVKYFFVCFSCKFAVFQKY